MLAWRGRHAKRTPRQKECERIRPRLWRTTARPSAALKTKNANRSPPTFSPARRHPRYRNQGKPARPGARADLAFPGARAPWAEGASMRAGRGGWRGVGGQRRHKGEGGPGARPCLLPMPLHRPAPGLASGRPPATSEPTGLCMWSVTRRVSGGGPAWRRRPGGFVCGAHKRARRAPSLSWGSSRFVRWPAHAKPGRTTHNAREGGWHRL
jgi:hypothetical protein